jgi:antitoxin VapB
MDTARLFQSGRSQAVRLPKAYRFSGTEVVVKHFGNGVLLRGVLLQIILQAPWPIPEKSIGATGFEPAT